jgi:hypothetical protein
MKHWQREFLKQAISAAIAFGIVFGVFLLAQGCAVLKPKPGGVCVQGDAICQPGNQAILCEGGKYVTVKCPGGCSFSSADRGVTCDQKGAGVGDSCPQASEGRAQCLASDPASYLVCNAGAWTQGQCIGGATCHVQGSAVQCQ